MMRYLVFAYDPYSPGGGWEHCVGRFADVDGAQSEAKRQVSKYNWLTVEIIDLTTGEEVEFDR